jgi:hypothetical protein
MINYKYEEGIGSVKLGMHPVVRTQNFNIYKLYALPLEYLIPPLLRITYGL